MAITRRLIAQDDNQDAQWLKVDHSTRYVENHSSEWQFVFGPNSELSNSAQVVKLSAKFNELSFDSIQMVAYLYDAKNASVSNAATCTFKVFKVLSPNWSESLLVDLSSSQLPNSYFYSELPIAGSGIDFQGGDTILIEATILRSGISYRDRVYFNHLGIYDNVDRLRKDVEFIDITKKDL